MTRQTATRRRRPAAWTAGVLALGSSLIGDFAHAADPDGEPPPPPRSLVLQPSAGIQESYTDNVALAASDRVSDTITRVLAALEAQFDSGRTTAKLDIAGGYDAYARQHFRSGWSAEGSAQAAYHLVPDLLSLKAEGAIANGPISTFSLSAADRHGAPGRVQLATYQVGPELTARVAGRFDVVAAARFADVIFSNASAGPLPLPRDDSMVQLAGAVSTDASRLQLLTSGEYIHDDQDFTSAKGIQSAFLATGRRLRLLARLGYERVHQGQQLDIEAPLASAGFEYRPTGRSKITVEGGQRYHRPAWSADAVVELSPRLLATASYGEQVQPDQVAVARSFQAFAESARTLPAPLVPRDFTVPGDLANGVSLYRSSVLRVVYDGVVNAVTLGADWTDRKFLTQPGRDKTVLTEAVFTRHLRRDLDLLLRANYGRTYESLIFGPSRAVAGAVQLSWRMSSHTTLTADVSRTDNRQLIPAGQRVTETAAFVALRRAF